MGSGLLSRRVVLPLIGAVVVALALGGLLASKNQSIGFDVPPRKVYGDQSFELTAHASSGLPVDVRLEGGPCVLNGLRVSISGAGRCTFTATQPGDGWRNPVSVAQTMTVEKGTQSITFGELPPTTYGAPPFSVSASASSKLLVGFEANGGCAIAGQTVSIRSAGPCTVTAVQDGDANWLAAARVARTLQVAKADQQISLSVPSPIWYGRGSVPVSATSTSPLAVSATASGACTITGGLVSPKGMIGNDICAVTATQAGDGNFNPAPPATVQATVIGLSWSCCRVIYSPPADFCHYFACIGDFGKSAGYVMQCADGLFSTAGGISGSCSVHGGNARALYAP